MNIYIEIVFEETNVMHVYAYDEFGNKVGFIDAEILENSVEIASIYVQESCRRLGIADMMLDELGDLLYDNGTVKDLHMVYCVDEKLNGLDAFMKYRYDFLVLENGFEYLVEPDVWKNTKTAKELMQICKRNFPKVRKMTDLSQSELNQLILKFKEAELNIQHKNIPISVYFDAELSYISIENDEIAAAVLSREIEDADEAVKVIELSAVLCDTGHELLMMESLAKFIGTMDKNIQIIRFDL